MSLVERLGHDAGERLLIVNCDDLGSSAAANRAIATVLKAGVATSATLMFPCPWALDGLEPARGFDIGVHLTFTTEYPTYRWRPLTGAKSLCDEQGYMPAEPATVWARADLAEVAAECRAQIDQALAWGLDPTHLDAHMCTMQIEPRYFALFVDLAVEYRLPLRMFGAGAERRLGFPGRSTASAAGVLYPDYFVSPWGHDARGVFADTLAHPRAGVTEIYFHPVEDGPELRCYDRKEAQIRVDDLTCLTDRGLKDEIEASGVKLISFRPLRDLQRQAG